MGGWPSGFDRGVRLTFLAPFAETQDFRRIVFFFGYQGSKRPSLGKGGGGVKLGQSPFHGLTPMTTKWLEHPRPETLASQCQK